VIVDYRPGAGIRVAPHFYTSDGELDAAVHAIDEILAKNEWKRYTHEKLVVT
jgi:kynureninase